MGRLKTRRFSRWFGWWYACISAGFLLLAIFYAIEHAAGFAVFLRAAIAVGFAALAWAELHRKKG